MLTNELKPAYKGLFSSSLPGDHRMHRPVCTEVCLSWGENIMLEIPAVNSETEKLQKTNVELIELINESPVTFLKLKTNINAGKKWVKQGKLE